MELRQVRSFVVLAQELHFSRAARRLNIVQPALSKQMKMLEDEIGVRLFDRNRRGVELNEAGRLFLAEAERALEHVERAVEAARRVALGQLGRVQIGYSASAIHSGVLSAALARIEAQWPDVEIVLERVDPWRQAERLLSREIDFIFGPRLVGDVVPDLETHSLAALEINVALSHRHPLAANSSIHPDDLKGEVFVEYANSEAEGYEIVARLLGVTPRAVITRPDPLSVLAIVQSGRGICALPSVLMLPAFPKVVYRGVVGAPVLEVAVMHRRNDDDPLMQNLRDLIHAVES